METNHNPPQPKDVFSSGDAYEPYIGRWSRLVAQKFVKWLAVPAGSLWLDVGCGTGALSEAILNAADPKEVKGIDSAEGYLAYARESIQDPRAFFQTGDAQALPVESAAYDAVVSGLVINFVPNPHEAAKEMARAARSGGIVATYLWDYPGRIQFMRHFWNAVAALDPAAADLDEGRRFPLCAPGPLTDLFQHAGLTRVEVQPIDIWMEFKDFDDYWSPFLGGQGPAAGYAMSISEEKRTALRERLRSALPFAVDGSLPLMARAWAVRGIR